jgi:hypothetical protein
MGLSLYKWQDRALAPLELATGKNAKRQNICVITPNGAGKDTIIICGAAHYWIANHPKGRVVITSKSDLQITEQTIPAIESHKAKFGYQSVKAPRYEMTTPTGGKCICFVTNKGERAEGWHKQDDFEGPLLLIINEAKSVDQQIFDALLGRCTPNAVMVVSSTGGKSGPLWDIATKHRERWTLIQVGLKDCPHIPQERIQFNIDTYGENHPHTRSTIYGEFMDQEDGDQYLVNAAALDSSIDFPPKHTPGVQRLGFCDFGGARSEHTFGIRDGNKLWIQDAWIEANPEAAAGRFIRNFRDSGLKEDQIWCDASDKDLAELLASHGWTIWRQNFGAPSMNPNYKSWGAEAWWESGLAVLKNEFILPNDEKMKAQAINRKKVITPTGKLGAEEKYDLAKRGVMSPDRWDTIAALMRCGGNAKVAKETFKLGPMGLGEYINEESEQMEEMGAFAGR